MSYAALIWALDQTPGNATDKLVLIALANYVAKDGGNVCWPGQETLAEFAGCSQDSVQRSLRRLAEAAYIRIERRTDMDGKRLSHRYVLNIHVTTQAPSGRQRVHKAAPPEQPDLLGHTATCGMDEGDRTGNGPQIKEGGEGCGEVQAANCGVEGASHTANHAANHTANHTANQAANCGLNLKEPLEPLEPSEPTHTPAHEPADPAAAPGRVCVGGGKPVDDLLAAGAAPHVVDHLIAPLLGVLRMPSGVDPTAFLAAICAECEEFADGALAEGAAVLRGARSYWPSPAQAKAAVAAVQPRHTIRLTPADATPWAAWMAEYHRRGHKFLARQAQQDGFIRVPRPFPLVRSGRAA